LEKSQPAKTLDLLQSRLRPFLQANGFRVRNRTFNRNTPDELTQVVSFQMGAFDPPGTTYVPGLTRNLYGQFTVNIGVNVPEVSRINGAHRIQDFVREYHCCVRARLGVLGSERQDCWWEIRDDEQIATELQLRLQRDAFPFLSRFVSRDLLLHEFIQMMNEGSPGFIGAPPLRITSAIILAARGRHEDARELLATQVQNSLNHHPRHADYVRSLAAQLGLNPLDL
jgi:hypothetical protein